MLKAIKKSAAILMAAVMVMAMGVTAFAAEDDASTERGKYKVELGGTSTAMTHMNPFEGADLSEDGKELTLYTNKLDVEIESAGQVVTGYISSLSVDGITPSSTEYTVEDGVRYPNVFKFNFDQAHTSQDTFNISFTITFVNSGTTHETTGATLTLNAR